jgi:hypothetical protein
VVKGLALRVKDRVPIGLPELALVAGEGEHFRVLCVKVQENIYAKNVMGKVGSTVTISWSVLKANEYHILLQHKTVLEVASTNEAHLGDSYSFSQILCPYVCIGDKKGSCC